jgi:hypothetical protein
MILRNCTVVILNDPFQNVRTLIAFNGEAGLSLLTPLDNDECLREASPDLMRELFSTPAMMAQAPDLARLILAELDRLQGVL